MSSQGQPETRGVASGVIGLRGAFTLLAFVLLLAAEASSNPQELPRPLAPVPQRTTSASLQVITDLDGDGKPDLVWTGPRAWGSNAASTELRLQLTAGRPSSLNIPASSTSLRVFARDVDSDLDLDLVVTAGWMDRLIGVWINDSRGGFTQNTPAGYATVFGHTSAGLVRPNPPSPGIVALLEPCSSLMLLSSNPLSLALPVSALRLPAHQDGWHPLPHLAFKHTRAPPCDAC